MNFHEDQFFHVYNQGNNRRKIFYSKKNYDFFKLKIGTYINPFAKVIAYCLMPNHFHLLIYVNKVVIPRHYFKEYYDQYQAAYYKKRNPRKKLYKSFIKSWKSEGITLNDSIGIMQRSYTRAINKRYNWSGSLFRTGCKAKDEWESKFQTIGDRNFFTGNMYVSKCFEYIHNNPVLAGFTEKPEDYDYSSAKDYKYGNNETICDLNLGNRIIL